MDFIHVTQQAVLNQLCEKMHKSTLLMVDTEFVRTRTLYPKLGLIQIFDGETLALIDPIAIADLSALWQLLSAPSILKVLHACSEDLEVFQRHAGFMPSPIIDTQLMAAFLGHGLSTGFASLIDQYLDISLNKAQARTDWCKRPLTEEQLHYAAADVYYLLPLYQKLKERIERRGWQNAVLQETEQLMQRRAKKPDPNKAYLAIKNAWQLNPKQLAALQLLASWRLQKAQQKDMALNFVVKDLHLWKMARYNIRSLDKMASEGFDRFEIEHHGSPMLRIMAEADKISADAYPKKIERLIDKSAYKQGVAKVKEQVNKVAEDLNLTPEFVGSNKQINQLLQWLWFDKKSAQEVPEIVSGWRGEHLASLLEPVLEKLAED